MRTRAHNVRPTVKPANGLVVLLAVLGLMLWLTPAGIAAPPSNDDFANATSIAALPYSDTVSDVAGATTAAGEPAYCGMGAHTVWYQFTAPRDGVLVASADASFYYYNTVLTVYRADGSGFGGLATQTCQLFSASTQFAVEAGKSYYLQAGERSSVPVSDTDWLTVTLAYATAPANDNFADATPVGSLPFADTQALAGASVERNEPVASCHGTLIHSAWYAFTPSTGGSYMVALGSGGIGDINVYVGSSLDQLTNLACAGGYNNTAANFTAVAGTTYYIQAGTWDLFASMQTTLQTTPQPVIQFLFPWPADPSIFDAPQFNAWFYDPAGVGISTWTWDFGDGTSTADVSYPTHRYATDGDYAVTLRVATYDGRATSQTVPVSVRTHDVAILSLVTPDKGKVGKPGVIGIGIGNTRYAETIQVDLYKVTPQGDVLVATQTGAVPVMKLKKTLNFSFNYVFTSSDALEGKVTFKAVATPQGVRDAVPSDNSATSPATLVTR